MVSRDRWCYETICLGIWGGYKLSETLSNLFYLKCFQVWLHNLLEIQSFSSLAAEFFHVFASFSMRQLVICTFWVLRCYFNHILQWPQILKMYIWSELILDHVCKKKFPDLKNSFVIFFGQLTLCWFPFQSVAAISLAFSPDKHSTFNGDFAFWQFCFNTPHLCRFCQFMLNSSKHNKRSIDSIIPAGFETTEALA